MRFSKHTETRWLVKPVGILTKFTLNMGKFRRLRYVIVLHLKKVCSDRINHNIHCFLSKFMEQICIALTYFKQILEVIWNIIFKISLELLIDGIKANLVLIRQQSGIFRNSFKLQIL